MMSLDQVVREMLIEVGESNENKYAKYLQHGISGLREMNMDFAGFPTTVQLPVQTTDTVNLPSDYINWVRVGAVDAFGNICALGLNPNISLHQKYNSCGVPISSVTNSVNASYTVVEGDSLPAAANGWEQYSDSWRNGEMLGRMFGVGGGNSPNGCFTVDKTNNTLVLQDVTVQNVMLEYLSDLTLVDGHYLVHPFIVEALKCYIFWKAHSRNLRVGLGDKEQARREYFNEYRRATLRFGSASVDEWLRTLRKGVKMAPKF